MAKNDYNPYSAQQEAIRKAKGNPNKNIHHKKNNSNYGGGDYAARKAAQKVQAKERPKLPRNIKILLAITFTVLFATLVLRLTLLKDNLVMSYISSLMVGITCAVLYYTRQYTMRDKIKSGFGKVIAVILVVMALLYGGMGIMGLANLA